MSHDNSTRMRDAVCKVFLFSVFFEVRGFQTTIAQLVTPSPHLNVTLVSSGLALTTSQTRNSSNLPPLSLVTSWFVSSPDSTPSSVALQVRGFQTTIAQLVTPSPHLNVTSVSSGLALTTSQTRNSSNLTSLSLVTSWFVSSPDSTPSSVALQASCMRQSRLPPVTCYSVCSPATVPFENNMYPYGLQQNDKEFGFEDSPYFYYGHCLRIDTDFTGFPFFSERHYKLYICRNGIIQLKYEWSWWRPRKFGVYWWMRYMAIIAPFWAKTDTYYAFRDGHSKVYYQVYSQTKKSSCEVLNMASQHVKLYGDSKKFANFAASWVLVVTWYKLCPYVYYSSNCRWSNTFQAVIITNGFNTFLMYNYPYGGIQWVVPVDREYYRYWTGYHGLPVAGWNAGNDGKNYYNHEA